MVKGKDGKFYFMDKEAIEHTAAMTISGGSSRPKSTAGNYLARKNRGGNSANNNKSVKSGTISDDLE